MSADTRKSESAKTANRRFRLEVLVVLTAGQGIRKQVRVLDETRTTPEMHAHPVKKRSRSECKNALIMSCCILIHPTTHLPGQQKLPPNPDPGLSAKSWP